MEIVPADQVFRAAASLFDAYRVHYGQPSDREQTRSWLAEQLGSRRLAMAVAIRDEQACGLITSAVLPASLRLGAVWVVRDLFVAPDHRRRGVARALLDHVIAEARAAGAVRMSLQTEPDNEPALALYAAAGFRPVDEVMSLNLPLS